MTSFPRTTVVLALGLSLLAGGVRADWPQFHGPERNGTAPDTGINKDWGAKPPTVLWETKLTDQGFGGPAVADGVVYIVDHVGGDDAIRALSLADGTEKWRYTYPQAGAENYGFTRATPSIVGDLLYSIGRKGQVLCLKSSDGSKVWERNVVDAFKGKGPRWDISNSPVIDGELLITYAGGDNANVVALGRHSGNTVWKGGGTAPVGYATPVVMDLHGVKQYVVFNGEAVLGLRPKDGKTLWMQKWRTSYDINAAMPVQIGQSHVWITSGYRRGCALVKVARDGSTELVYKSKEISAHWSSAVLDGDVLYSTSDPGFLVCMDPMTGEVKWKSKGNAKGFEKGGLCSVDGTLIVIEGNTGNVVQVEKTPEAYREMGRINPLNSAKCWVAPVVSDGKLLVRSPSKLVCLDITK